MNTDIAEEHCRALQSKLPHWHFVPYGQHGAAACYPVPPMKVGPDAFIELSRYAVISSVCGPLYVVTQLADCRRCGHWPLDEHGNCECCAQDRRDEQQLPKDCKTI